MDCVNPKFITTTGIIYQKKEKCYFDEEYHKVPCGKCGFCLQSKRSQWMFRIFWEMHHQMHPGWFVTLTYNEKYVKRTADNRLSLRFTDVQKFIKKLRKAKYYVKYICVGEYGSKTNRPHYHLLLWTDCLVESLESFWSNGKGERLGNIHLGRITMQSAMYTLKYIIQPKQKAGEGLEPTRGQYSKGLGLAYLSAAVYDYHTWDYDSPVFTSMVEGKRVALPRYYQYKIFTKYQRRLERCRLSIERWKKKKEEYRALRKQGIKNVRAYLFGLRLDRARAILKESKFNEKL